MVDYDENNKPYLRPFLKTDAGRRNIPIPARLYDQLYKYVSETCKNDDELLFATKNDTIMSDGVFTSRWRTLRNKINQFMPEGKTTSVSMHYLRHTYATDLYYAKVDIKAAQYLLGHTSIEVTMNLYTDLILDNSDVTSALDSYYEGLEKNVISKMSVKSEISLISHTPKTA